MRPRKLWARAADVAAIVVVALVLYKFLVAPRTFRAADARPAPDVTLKAMDRGTFSLAAHRGRVVFLDFWASWCEPCRLSFPLVERYARTHPEADVIAVDVGEPEAAAIEFARANHLRNVVFDRDERVAHAFGVDGFPTLVVIDKSGLVRAKWAGFNPAIESAMANAERAFAEPTKVTTR